MHNAEIYSIDALNCIAKVYKFYEFCIKLQPIIIARLSLHDLQYKANTLACFSEGVRILCKRSVGAVSDSREPTKIIERFREQSLSRFFFGVEKHGTKPIIKRLVICCYSQFSVLLAHQI